jgi:hypothetical protein
MCVPLSKAADATGSDVLVVEPVSTIEHVVTIATTKMEKVLANLGRGWR